MQQVKVGGGLRAPGAAAPVSEEGDWRAQRDRSTALGVAAIQLVTRFGRAPARWIMRLVALYYTATSGEARRATRAYLERIGERPTLARVHRQILRFAQVGLDALWFAQGKVARFRVTRTGRHHLAKLQRERQSAILLGAHLGSFHALRAAGEDENLPLYAVMYTKHARRLNEYLARLDPTSKARVLSLGEGVDFMFQIRDLTDEGALIAIMADRASPGERYVDVDFLGGPARFPTGPYLLAATLGLPVYLTFGLYRGGDRYDLFCEPFAEKVVLPRRGREDALRGYVERYVARLEHFCREAPDNWFNFHSFWREEKAAERSGAGPGRPPVR